MPFPGFILLLAGCSALVAAGPDPGRVTAHRLNRYEYTTAVFGNIGDVLGGRIRSGRHIAYPDGTPMANFHLSMLDTVGVPTDKVGDSNGELNLLTDF